MEIKNDFEKLTETSINLFDDEELLKISPDEYARILEKELSRKKGTGRPIQGGKKWKT